MLISEPEFAKGEHVFRAAPLPCSPVLPDEESICETVRTCGGAHVIVGIQPYRGPIYAALRPGSVLARFGVGHDGIDKAQATRAGIFCTNTPGVLDDSVAEQTIALILAVARHVPRVATALKAGNWRPELGRELRGRVLVIVGCGGIGSAVARIAKCGFGMRVIGLIHTSLPKNREWFDDVTSDVAAAFGAADFVSLHIPASARNRHFMNRERIALLPRSAWIINTARGSVLDEAALYDALFTGTIAGAALDVFECEPYRPADPLKDLRTLDNVWLTPHVGSNTVDANTRMAERALENILCAERRDYNAMDLLNPEVLQLPAWKGK